MDRFKIINNSFFINDTEINNVTYFKIEKDGQKKSEVTLKIDAVLEGLDFKDFRF